MTIQPILPYLNPTDSFYVWEYEKIKKYKGKTAVYVFWDEKGYWQGAKRYDYETDHHPLYIGMTSDLGYRIVEHLTGDKHTKHYSIYFYGVDVYVFEDLKETDPVIQSMRKDLFNYKSMAYLYEMYFIMRRLPWFNDTHNIYWAKKPMRLRYFKHGLYKKRRSDWARRVAGVSNGFNKVQELAQEWKTPERVIQSERYITVEELVSHAIFSYSDINKLKIEKSLTQFIIDRINSNTFLMTPIEQVREDLQVFEFTKQENGVYKIASDVLLYYKAPKSLIKRLIK